MDSAVSCFLLLASVGVSATGLARSAELSATAGIAHRGSKGDTEESVEEGSSVPAPSCRHINQPIEQGSQPLSID